MEIKTIAQFAAHLVGLPVMAITLLNISFDTWKGWIMLIVSVLYGLSFTVIRAIKGYQDIRRENFEHKLRRKKSGL